MGGQRLVGREGRALKEGRLRREGGGEGAPWSLCACAVGQSGGKFMRAGTETGKPYRAGGWATLLS